MPQSPTPVNIATQASGGVNARVPLILDPQGALPNAAQHGGLFGASSGGRLMQGGNQFAAPATLSVALNTTYVGLCLSNPANSGVNLSLLRVAGLLVVAPAALTALGLITGWTNAGIVTHTTPLAPRNAFLHMAAPVGLLDQACTIGGNGANAPAWSRWFGVTPGATSVFSFAENIDGGLIIPPGGYACVGSSIAGPASGFLGSMVWEELAIG